MKKQIKVPAILSLVLFGLLLIPLDGTVNNTFVFFIGRFHPIILHLPIGGLAALFVMEIINSYRPQLNLDSACSILLWFSVITVIPSAILGFVLASSGNYDDELLNLHKWLGWLTALVCVWLLYFNSKSKKTYRVFLYANVIFLLFAGHFGGQLTHGKDYLTKYMPISMKKVLNIDDERNYLVVDRKIDSLSTGATYYTDQIKPIIENYCYKCHGQEKQKGDMRFDNIDWDMVNGFDAEKWNMMLNEINLGEMPPSDELQLSEDDRRILVDWITENLDKAAEAKETDSKLVMRRQTKSQYTNSLNELLGVYINFGDLLPDDGKSKMGFTNNGNILQTSSLHIDYYQKLAREALDKALVKGEKPKSRRYKVVLGKNKGDDVLGAEFGGYQTAPINNKDFDVQILDMNGKPVKKSSSIGDSIKVLKNKIGIGMRGSASNRYYIVDEGMILNSALPAKEVTPKSWQGPSPNLKLLIKEDFPREGKYAFRVEASKGYNSLSIERLIDLREKEPALDFENSFSVNAKDLNIKNSFTFDNKNLIPKEFATFSEIEFTYDVPFDGIYKIDLVHPYVSNDVMPSYHIRFLGRKEEGVISKRLNINQNEKLEEITTPVTLAYLTKGKHKGFIGGKFFVGFSKLIFTPVTKDDPLPKTLQKESQKNNFQYERVNPSILAFAGSRTDDGMDYKALSKPIEVKNSMEDSQVFEFTGMLENLPVPMASDDVSGELANIVTFGLWNNHLVKESSLKGPPLLIKSVEFEAPYYPVWPPKSYTEIFFKSKNQNNEEAYANEVIEKFMERAFRRTLNDSELDRYITFWKNIRSDFDSFEDGVKEVLIAILCSPNFIYLNQPMKLNSGEYDDEYYLASQLSYFLWNSPPDDKLIELASKGKLYRNLPSQIDRMIKNSKIENLINGFSYEWLRLDRHKNMDVNVQEYEDYTRFVKEDMFSETYEFVKHILINDLSIMNFIDSDFAMLNQNLAEFYGLNGVEGNEFRAVKLNKNQNRGGLLSQGSFLTGHSDGTQPHAIKRAVWLKEKILGDHPPPPPPNVPELDSETPGFEKLTLKEQLFLHRNKVSCMGCHKKIDPYGVIFENYDATGRYQLTMKGKPIDSKSVLPDGNEVDGIQDMKDYILKFKTEDFTKSIVKNLFSYANGRDVGFADEKEIKYIVERVKRDNYSFKTVIQEIIYSPSFYKKKKNWFSKLFKNE
ncbi:DUF1592 domain-containing protein [Flavobacteriaceae bacterium]|nr:DUF1592 domain-containing protein [Flavobacteriaceae bacterium]MDA9000167.1 DUF1592 domain-containing protein [Flavobacteriaceae bacterium]MDB4819903.1 DUF1592 domain-containing protein [Flavobacteriaceae bacterium]